MVTLCVENIPRDIYKALRKRARVPRGALARQVARHILS
jgi:hypothetical protein